MQEINYDIIKCLNKLVEHQSREKCATFWDKGFQYIFSYFKKSRKLNSEFYISKMRSKSGMYPGSI